MFPAPSLESADKAFDGLEERNGQHQRRFHLVFYDTKRNLLNLGAAFSGTLYDSDTSRAT